MKDGGHEDQIRVIVYQKSARLRDGVKPKPYLPDERSKYRKPDVRLATTQDLMAEDDRSGFCAKILSGLRDCI